MATERRPAFNGAPPQTPTNEVSAPMGRPTIVGRENSASPADMNGRMWEDLTHVRTRIESVEEDIADAKREHAVHVSVCAERYMAIQLEQKRTVKLIQWVLGLSSVGVLFELGRVSFPDLVRALVAFH